MINRLRTVFSGPHETLKIMVAASVFIFLRSPKLLISGRVVAEEGTVYFQDAWNSPFWKAFPAPHQGYYSLLDNLAAAIAAHALPLAWTANFFTFSALLTLLLLVYIAITCEVFRTTEARLLAALICLISPSLEVWLTLEDAQFCLAASVALILLSDSARHRVVRSLTLVLAGLTGPVSCALAPFAWVQVYTRRSWSAAWQALLLTACAAVQAACLLHAIRAGERGVAAGSKLSWIGPIFLTKVVCVTFGTRLSFFLFVKLLTSHFSTPLFAVCWALALAGLLCLLYVARLAGRAGWVLMALACYSFLFAYLGIGEPTQTVIGGANRYFFVSDLLLWLMILVGWLHTREQGGTSRFARGLLSLIVLAGLLDCAGYWKKSQWNEAPWRPQAARWTRDPSTTIRVSPATWPHRVVLNPHGLSSGEPAE